MQCTINGKLDPAFNFWQISSRNHRYLLIEFQLRRRHSVNPLESDQFRDLLGREIDAPITFVVSLGREQDETAGLDSIDVIAVKGMEFLGQFLER
jgi:hypothetical protein